MRNMEYIKLTTNIIDRYTTEELYQKILLENKKFNLSKYINQKDRNIAIILIPKKQFDNPNPFISECFVYHQNQLYHKFTLELFYKVIDKENYKYDKTYGGNFNKISIPRQDIVIRFLNKRPSMIFMPETITQYQYEELYKLSQIIKDKEKFICNILEDEYIHTLEYILNNIKVEKNKSL